MYLLVPHFSLTAGASDHEVIHPGLNGIADVASANSAEDGVSPGTGAAGVNASVRVMASVRL